MFVPSLIIFTLIRSFHLGIRPGRIRTELQLGTSRPWVTPALNQDPVASLLVALLLHPSRFFQVLEDLKVKKMIWVTIWHGQRVSALQTLFQTRTELGWIWSLLGNVRGKNSVISAKVYSTLTPLNLSKFLLGIFHLFQPVLILVKFDREFNFKPF